MSDLSLDLDLDDETDTSCGEEQMVAELEVNKEWLENMLSEHYKGKAVSSFWMSELYDVCVRNCRYE